MDFQTILCSSLAKVMPQDAPQMSPIRNFSCLRGENFSFQVAFKSNDISWVYASGAVRVEVKSPLKKYIRIRAVENVPVAWMPDGIDDDVVSDKVGMYPDILRDLEEGNIIRNYRRVWRALWFDVELPAKCKSGKYEIEVLLHVTDIEQQHNGVKAEKNFSEKLTLDVLDAVLPPQTLKCDHWFHADCLSTHYGIEPFCDEFWRITGNFMKAASRNGINMLLTPLFTPPLDTFVGTYRPRVQLVKITCDKGKYSFDFTLLEKWIEVAKKNGITHFEMPHMFTQWGCKATPQIWATVDGKEKRIFGWDVKALSTKYRNFLDQFLPELKKFFEKRKLRKNVYFHCSDEPSLPHLPQFKKCAELLARHLDGWNLFDGGTLDVYKQGLIPIPIPIAPITTLEKFMGVEVKERWTAYCCFPQVEYVNRFIHMTSSRNRIFGAQLYRFNVEGFLHWGFNFYYSGLSLKPVDPYKDTCCYYTYPSGDAFLVYPRKDGVPEESLRLKVFGHALQDQRAMQLLETMIGRPKVEKILDKCSPNGELHMHDYPRGEKAVLALREKINAEIKKNLNKCAD